MENLVRRLGRILNKKKVKQFAPSEPEECLSVRMDRLENALSAWVAQGGWRLPRRTLSEAAADLGTDTVTLHHYFQERTGLDFRTWRTRLRLEEAARLLVEEPETKVLDIAERVGFSNRSNFSRQFLAYTGMTPARWREKARTSLDGRA
ncbi:MAG: AraC family transcriptional regulator [Bacteroidales bacterium]|nr:AraC family transcriptional regulator [Bacteroidales bacterium]